MVDVISSSGLLNNKRLKEGLNIHVKGSFLEYIGDLDMKKQADQRKMEQELQRAIQTRCSSLIHMMQKNRPIRSKSANTFAIIFLISYGTVWTGEILSPLPSRLLCK